MHIEHAGTLIGNYFIHNPQISTVTLGTIYQLKVELEEKFKKKGLAVYIDFTDKALFEAMTSNASHFTRNMDEGTIALKNRDRMTKDSRYFTQKIDENIRETFVQLVKNFKETDPETFSVEI